MNIKFQKVKEEDVLFFDCEVVRAYEELEIGSVEYELYKKKTRDRATDEPLSDQDLLENYRDRAALKMTYSTIVTIGVGFIKGGKVYIKDITGTEEEIIREFCKIANQFKYVSGANILEFDLPIIINNGWKYMNMAESLKDAFITSGKKPWNLDYVIDVMDVFRGTHYFKSSVEEICRHFGIPTPKDGVTGSEVSEVYYSEGVKRISTYVKKDVLANINIFRKMQFKSIFTDFIDKTGTPEEKKPLIERIFTKGQIDPEDYDELLKVAKGKTAKEKQELCDIVKGALLSKHKKTLDEDEISVLDAIKKVK